MAESVSRLGTQSGANQPIALRRLRVESEFRETTRGLERKERDKYSSVLWNLVRLEMAPKVKIMDLVGPALDGTINPQDEGSLKSVVDFYHKRPSRSELIHVLKFFSVYLIQRARRETSFTRQQFLLFKAIDLLRSIVHFSAWSVHRDAEALVYGIIDDMNTQKPGPFARYAACERHIYPIMKKLQEVPRDFTLRIQLGEEYIRQTSFFDALVQFDFLNRFYPRFFKDRNLDARLALVYTKIAELFQNMIDHMGKGYRDARKVNAFIERYNREFATRKLMLVPIQEMNRANLSRTVRSLRAVAETWYRRALGLKMMRPEQRTDCARHLARNLVQEGRNREAYAVLFDNYRYWAGRGNAAEDLRGQVDYLETMINVAVKLRRRNQASWASMEQREARMKLDDLIKAQTDYQRRREQIKREAGAGEEEEEVV